MTDWRTKRRWIDYTSSSLITRDKTANNGGAWTYGRFEMRGKIDIRQGMWPAFWTVGQSGEWPGSGEIDIMEFYRGKLLANLGLGHVNQRWNGKWNAKSKADQQSSTIHNGPTNFTSGRWIGTRKKSRFRSMAKC